jgi:hypothetical protein
MHLWTDSHPRAHAASSHFRFLGRRRGEIRAHRPLMAPAVLFQWLSLFCNARRVQIKA